MTDRISSQLRLSPKERQALEMAIHGAPVDRMAVTLKQSPKVVERYIHQGIRKLELWSHNAVPGPNYNTTQENESGFLRPRQAERLIARKVQEIGSKWACVVILAIPEDPDSREHEPIADLVCEAIQKSTRQSDVVTKWSKTEWVIFLTNVTPLQTDMVVRRLKHWQPTSWRLLIGAQQPEERASFTETVSLCHKKLISHYVNQDLVSLLIPFPESHTS